MRRGMSAAALAAVFCAVVWAQFQFGSVTGLVKDPSQAPVPAALELSTAAQAGLAQAPFAPYTSTRRKTSLKQD